MIGLIAFGLHVLVDHIIEGINYYILTPLENAGIPVPMTYTNVANGIDEAIIILGMIFLLSAPVPSLILLYRAIKEMRGGTSI